MRFLGLYVTVALSVKLSTSLTDDTFNTVVGDGTDTATPSGILDNVSMSGVMETDDSFPRP